MMKHSKHLTASRKSSDLVAVSGEVAKLPRGLVLGESLWPTGPQGRPPRILLQASPCRPRASPLVPPIVPGVAKESLKMGQNKQCVSCSKINEQLVHKVQ